MNATVRAGVDEAGLGPLLGPLCIGYSIFEIPGENISLRKLLRAACAGENSKINENDARVRVCDSKRLHRGKHKFEHLEHTALSFLVASNGGKPIDNIAEVLQFGVTRPGVFNNYPWYCDTDAKIPVAASRDAVMRSAEKILTACERNRVKILELGTRVVPELELNDLFHKLNNKSLALFESVSPIFARVGEYAAKRPLLVCDRHGARAAYAPLLSKAFGGAWIKIIKEARGESLYQIAAENGRVRVVFTEKGESKSFACALASCLAKYARELAMNRFNHYFSKIAPGVRPTAGYYTDGKRYLNEAGPALRAAGIDTAALKRNR
ncbi:MAG: hypothetical protein ACKVS6_03425 [Planctomycetota bacterium]